MKFYNQIVIECKICRCELTQGEVESHVKICKAEILLECKEFDYTSCEFTCTGTYEQVKLQFEEHIRECH